MADQGKILVKGGLVYDHDGDVHKPARADMLIEGSRIAAVGKELAAPRTAGAQVIDASRPHRHARPHQRRTTTPTTRCAAACSRSCRSNSGCSTRCRWAVIAARQEVRLRTLVGALEAMRCGITCLQDMLGLMPLDEDNLDIVIDAYAEIGERVVFAPMVSDVPAIAMVRHRDLLPPEIQEMIGTRTLGTAREQIDFLDAQIKRHPAADTLHWACGPFAPQRASPELLGMCADFAERHDLGRLHPRLRDTRAGGARARGSTQSTAARSSST